MSRRTVVRLGRIPEGKTQDELKAEKEKNKEFAVFLEHKLRTHTGSVKVPIPFKPFSVVREMGLREIGSCKQRPARIYPSLLCSNTRQLEPTERLRFKRGAKFDGVIAVAPFEQEVHDLQLAGPSFKMPELRSTEKPVYWLKTEGVIPAAGFDGPEWVIVLTSHGRLLFIQSNTGELEYKYQLPAHLYKFVSLSWNNANEDFYVMGRNLAAHIDDAIDPTIHRRHAFTDKSFAIAFFQLSPLQFKGMIEITKQTFHNPHEVLLNQNILYTFCTQPNQSIAYNFDDMYRNCCIRPFAPFEGSDGSIVLPFNIRVERDEQKKILYQLELKGFYDNIQVGVPFSIFEPKSDRMRYMIKSLRDLDKEPILGKDYRNLCIRDGLRYGLELSFPTTVLHFDESNRILRFEKDFLCCYAIVSIPNTDDSKLCLQWKTPIVPSSRGSHLAMLDTPWIQSVAGTGPNSRPKRVRAQAPPSQEDSHVMVHQLNYDGYSMLTLLIYYSTDIMERRSVYNEESTDNAYFAAMLCLDSVSGSILRVIPLNSGQGVRWNPLDIRFHELSRRDDFFVSTASDQLKTTIDVYRLIEPQQIEWKPDETKPKLSFEPATCSRKERRKKRREAVA